MNIALNGNEIVEALDGKCKVLSYDELLKYDTIDEALYPYNKLVILYFWDFSNNVKSGHYIAIRKDRIKNVIYVFDSYGRFIDDNLAEIEPYKRRKYKEDFKQLTYLLYKSPYKVEYNEFQFQQNDSAVCGRYAIYFLLRDDLDMVNFQKQFDKKDYKKNDKLILELTNFI
jgi:hypothetical protein